MRDATPPNRTTLKPHDLKGAAALITGASRGLGRALADALADALVDLTGRRVLYPRAETVPPDFEARLRQAGAELIPIPLYETVCPEGSREAMISARPFSVITLASGSAARHLAALGLDLEG
ncbi:MAG: uroporphyrinogen-III synthase, partial [Myxococcales bacterium]|nr:uroporphyrinogen-III synthase [Myxococcales bacterium]